MTSSVALVSARISTTSGIHVSDASQQSLGVVAHSGEEPAFGPTSFSVDADGVVSIPDPVRDRLVKFQVSGSTANYLSQEPLRSVSESIHTADTSNTNVTVSLIDRHSAMVYPLPGRDHRQGISIRPSDPTDQIASISTLSTDRAGATYVLLELQAPSGQVNVHREIRKYSNNSTLLCRITGIPAQAELAPTTEFVEKNGYIYQMVVGVDGVLINTWNTNNPIKPEKANR